MLNVEHTVDPGGVLRILFSYCTRNVPRAKEYPEVLEKTALAT